MFLEDKETVITEEQKSTCYFSKVMRSGKRTYFFDVKENKAGDRYLTITESCRIVDEEGKVQGYKKSKVFLHSRDIQKFLFAFKEAAGHLPWYQANLPGITLELIKSETEV